MFKKLIYIRLLVVLSHLGRRFSVMVKHPQEVQIFQNRLPTKNRLSKWGIQCGTTCVLCHQEDETRDHLFSSRPFIQNMHQLISSFVPDFRWSSSFDDAVKDMSRMCKRRKSRAFIHVSLWIVMLYQTWLQRNLRVFREPRIFAQQLVRTVLFIVAARYWLLVSSLFVWGCWSLLALVCFVQVVGLSALALCNSHFVCGECSFYNQGCKRVFFLGVNILLLIVKKKKMIPLFFVKKWSHSF